MLKSIVRYAMVGLFAASASVMSYSQSTGADTYKAKCQMCHAADGTGNTPAGKALKAASFNSPEIVAKSDADLIATVKQGKGKMPSFTDKLTDAQINDVVAYVRTLQKAKPPDSGPDTH